LFGSVGRNGVANRDGLPYGNSEFLPKEDTIEGCSLGSLFEKLVCGASLCDLFRHGEHAVEMTSLRDLVCGVSLAMFVEFLYVISFATANTPSR